MPYGNVSTGRLLTGAGTSLTTVRVGCCRNWGRTSFCLPTRGSDWYDGAVYQKFHHHEYTEDMTRVETGWTNFAMGVALAWDALEDLENVDFDALGFEEGTRESMLNQQRTLAASFYLDGLDFSAGCLCTRRPRAK